MRSGKREILEIASSVEAEHHFLFSSSREVMLEFISKHLPWCKAKEHLCEAVANSAANLDALPCTFVSLLKKEPWECLPSVLHGALQE